MPKLWKSIGLAGLAGLLAFGTIATSVAPVSAQPWRGYHRPYYGYSYRPYRPYYRPYYYDPGPAIAGSIIGGVFGAIAGSAISGSSHVARCENAYRSYQRSTNTYLGYDGVRHVCRL